MFMIAPVQHVLLMLCRRKLALCGLTSQCGHMIAYTLAGVKQMVLKIIFVNNLDGIIP
jgi:uncharacterized membrane protein YjjB (DUF3815 family)